MSQDKFKTHISQFCGLVYTQQMAEQERILKNPDDVYDGFCDKARPIDALPAYLSERSGISFGDACDYIARAGRGGHWDGLKRVSGEVRSDITAISQPVSACFRRDAMDELVEWFVDEYPHEAAEAGLLDSVTRSTSADVGEPAEDQADAGDTVPADAPKTNEPQLGTVERTKMRVYTSGGWVDVSHSSMLDAVEALTRDKGAWLVGWKCFGTDCNTNMRMDKELKCVSMKLSRHIESSPNGYRWVDYPKTTTKRRKSKQSK